MYPIPIIDGKVVVGNKQELTGYNPNISSDNMKEFGLTGMLVNDDYIFTAVTTINKELKTGIAKITRISYTVDENSPQSVILNNETDIYVREGSEIKANAHNLHLGCFTKLGDKDWTFLIVPFGDLNQASKYCYNKSVDYGKLLIMDEDGYVPNKDYFDTGFDNNMHLAYGNRNMFQLTQLSKDVDSMERFVWGENGDTTQRVCIMTLNVPYQRYDLQWSGDGDTQDWLSMSDPVTGSSAVLWSDVDTAGVWTTSIPPGAGYIFDDIDAGVAIVLRSYMASKDSLPDRSRSLNLEYISNLNDAPQPAGLGFTTPLIQSDNDYVSSLMSSSIHPTTGDIFVSDVFTGNIIQLRLQASFPYRYSVGNINQVTRITPFYMFIIIGVLVTIILIFMVAMLRQKNTIRKYRSP